MAALLSRHGLVHVDVGDLRADVLHLQRATTKELLQYWPFKIIPPANALEPVTWCALYTMTNRVSHDKWKMGSRPERFLGGTGQTLGLTCCRNTDKAR